MNGQNYLLTAGEVAETLGVSKGHAYKLIRELNEELQSKGYLVVAGKVPKAFWETKFYGYNQPMNNPASVSLLSGVWKPQIRF